MLRYSDITLARIRSFLAPENLPSQLYKASIPLALRHVAVHDRLPYAEAMHAFELQNQRIDLGFHFAPLWSTHWVECRANIPSEWRGEEVHLLWDSVSEACVWKDGEPLQGLTGSDRTPEPIRGCYLIDRNTKGDQSICYFIEVACNGLFGIQEFGTKRLDIGKLKRAEVGVFSRDAWNLLSDFRIIADLACHLPRDSTRSGEALRVANDIINHVRFDAPKTIIEARALAREFFNAKAAKSSHQLSAIGHAHIDTAWLWPVAETKRKCVRTFSAALRAMELYPNFRFACSQAQHLAWVKEHNASLYQQIKTRSDRFHAVGGSWVEPDCNIPSGESLIRQFLYGQKFYQQEFGRRCDVFWNPDVFGYSAALPQILKKCGIKYFLTQKLSWNQFNKPRANTFLWEGLDGSTVLTHFPPADTYNSLANVEQVLANVSKFKDHDRARESYLLFGYGDGGGGPTWEMLENLERMRDIDALPQIEQRSPSEFFERCERDIRDPLRWVGELYFELHRGTFTTQAHTKKLNRQCERALQNAEFAHAAHFAVTGEFLDIDFESLWKTLLINQFHDILPGTSIGEVYETAESELNAVLCEAKNIQNQITDKGEHLVFNSICVSRIELMDGHLYQLEPFSLQAPTRLSASFGNVWCQVNSDGVVLRNDFVQTRFDDSGLLRSLIFEGRELIPVSEAGNDFALYDDRPLRWDAWDVDIYHLEKRLPRSSEPVQVRRIHESPASVCIEFSGSLSSHSSWRQRVTLNSHEPQIRFENWIDWHEEHVFLKVEFPLAIRALKACYEVQHGVVERPTHSNTTWDMAQFEVPAQRFADLSDGDYGVALLNDCKYGYSARRHVLCLSLLRSPKNPDPNADRGQHHFSFALLPHRGDYRRGGVVDAALKFNSPVQKVESKHSYGALFSHSAEGVVLDAVKIAEDRDSIVLRMYECFGRPLSFVLHSGFDFSRVSRCNFLEDVEAVCNPISSREVRVTLEPFECLSLRFWRR